MGKAVRRIKTIVSSVTATQRKLLWLLVHGSNRDTTPVFIVGSQRSGTSILGDCLGTSPEIENLGESDEEAFVDYSLKSDDVVERIIEKSRYRFIVFKPLKDSHRLEQLLALNPLAKGIWVYRSYLDRINSAVKKFGRHPLEVFAAFKKCQLRAWQLRGISGSDENLIKSLDFDRLSENDGAALMWYIRNALYFNQNLEKNSRVVLFSYDSFVTDPSGDLKSLLHFLGANYYPFMAGKVHSLSLQKESAPTIDPRIEALCRSMYERIDSIRRKQGAL